MEEELGEVFSTPRVTEVIPGALRGEPTTDLAWASPPRYRLGQRQATSNAPAD
jgi:hypothetical protein